MSARRRDGSRRALAASGRTARMWPIVAHRQLWRIVIAHHVRTAGPQFAYSTVPGSPLNRHLPTTINLRVDGIGVSCAASKLRQRQQVATYVRCWLCQASDPRLTATAMPGHTRPINAELPAPTRNADRATPCRVQADTQLHDFGKRDHLRTPAMLRYEYAEAVTD